MLPLAFIPSFVVIISLFSFLEAPVATHNIYSTRIIVGKNSVHIRKDPSIHGAILQTVDKGADFKMIDSVNNGWFKIAMADSTFGYIHNELASARPQLESTQVTRRFDERPGTKQFLILTTIVLLFIYCIWIFRLDKKRRTLEIYYEMDDERKRLHEKLLEYFNDLMISNKIWSTLSTEEVVDRKYNSGASRLVSRATIQSISGDKKPVRFLNTNVRIPNIDLKGISLFFFPERLVMEQDGEFSAVQYKNISVSIDTTRFIESGLTPSDANVIDHTWQFLNKDGGADMRFNYNPRLPICLYSVYTISSTEGLDLVITTSKPGAMDNLASFMNQLTS